jgi:hypothetical protein
MMNWAGARRRLPRWGAQDRPRRSPADHVRRPRGRRDGPRPPAPGCSSGFPSWRVPWGPPGSGPPGFVAHGHRCRGTARSRRPRRALSCWVSLSSRLRQRGPRTAPTVVGTTARMDPRLIGPVFSSVHFIQCTPRKGSPGCCRWQHQQRGAESPRNASDPAPALTRPSWPRTGRERRPPGGARPALSARRGPLSRAGGRHPAQPSLPHDRKPRRTGVPRGGSVT